MKKISSDARKILKQYKRNDKYDIIKTFYGRNAVQKIKNLFFPKNKRASTKWASRWTNKEKSQSVFFVFLKKLKKNTYVYFKFIIGSGENLSVLGEVVRKYEAGIRKLKKL